MGSMTVEVSELSLINHIIECTEILAGKFKMRNVPGHPSKAGKEKTNSIIFARHARTQWWYFYVRLVSIKFCTSLLFEETTEVSRSLC